MHDRSSQGGSLHRKQEQDAYITLIQDSRCGPPGSEDGGGAAGWSATDGMEDSHRVRQRASWTVVHWVYLKTARSG